MQSITAEEKTGQRNAALKHQNTRKQQSAVLS